MKIAIHLSIIMRVSLTEDGVFVFMCMFLSDGGYRYVGCEVEIRSQFLLKGMKMIFLSKTRIG